MMRSGQLFTTDFIVSLVLFMSVLGTVFYGIGTSVDQQAQRNDRAVLQQRAAQTADLLVRTSGYPADWNASSVRVTGLASDDHIIEPGKFIELRETGYDRFRAINRFSRSDVVINITANGSAVSVGGFAGQRVAIVTGQQGLFDMLTHSGADWDLYWTDGAAPAAPDAGAVHTGSDAGMMEAALSNRSAYDAIIADRSGLNASDVSGSARLDGFIEAGGRYLQVGGGDLITVLGGTAVTDPPTAGTVRSARYLNRDLDTGDSIELGDAPVGLTGVGSVLVNASTGECLACTLRGGDVLFLAGPDLTTASRDTNGLDTTRLADAYLFGTNGTFGQDPPDDALTIIPVRRDLLLEGDRLRLGELAVVVWR